MILCLSLMSRKSRSHQLAATLPLKSSSHALSRRWTIQKSFLLQKYVFLFILLFYCLLSQYEGRAVGMMSVTSNVTLSAIEHDFDISDFDNFRDDLNSFFSFFLSFWIVYMFIYCLFLVPSAVCITLFCLKTEFEHRSADFIRFVFSIFEKHMYCFITLPHTLQEFPLLYNFTQVCFF